MNDESTIKQPLDTTSTRVIGRRVLTVDGAPFQWWAVGERPTLVTVRSAVFGSSSDFTDGEPSAHAKILARRMLTEHYDRADRLRAAKGASAPETETETRLESPRNRGPYGLRMLDD